MADNKTVGVKNNKAKSRRQAHNRVIGKYTKQVARTEENRVKKWKRHVKKHPNYIRGMERIKEALSL